MSKGKFHHAKSTRRLIPISLTLLTFLLLVTIASTSQPATALASNTNPPTAEIIDIAQEEVDYGFGYALADSPDFILWQQFIPTIDNLTAIELFLQKAGTSGDTIVELQSGDGATVLATSTILEANMPDYDWVRADFGSVSLTPNETYRISVDGNVLSADPENRYFWRGSNLSGFCPACSNNVIEQWPDFDFAFRTIGDDGTSGGDEYDFGDHDSPYPTLLADDGARHLFDANVFLGVSIDAESDGQPTATASGDGADEDGIFFNSSYATCDPATIDIVASTSGYINSWIDWNNNGSWDDASDHTFVDIPVDVGTTRVDLIVPCDAVPDVGLAARFRFSTVSGAAPTGEAPDGEVEDYFLQVSGGAGGDEYDFGDHRRAFPTLLEDDGARHVYDANIFLGSSIDAETDGQPSVNADGDGADEDGITFNNTLMACGPATIDVEASTNGYLNAWFDWDDNLSWDETRDHSIFDIPVNAGTNTLAFIVPCEAIQNDDLAARFRFSTGFGLTPSGEAADGEVEDYNVQVIGGGVIAQPDWVATAENNAVVIFPLGNDTGDSLTIANVGTPVNGTIQQNGDSLTYTPNTDYSGLDSFDYTAREADGDESIGRITVSILDDNTPPTAIYLDNNLLLAGATSGTVIGTLSTSDPDPSDTHTYSLDGGLDSQYFGVAGDALLVNQLLGFAGSFIVPVTVTDSDGATFSQQFVIDVLPADADPENDAVAGQIQLNPNTVAENQPSGTFVGVFETVDFDDDWFDWFNFSFDTYELVDGQGSDDNAWFTVSGDSLQTAASLDFDVQDIFRIRVKADNGNGGVVEQQMIVFLTDDPNDDGPPAEPVDCSEGDITLFAGEGSAVISRNGTGCNINGTLTVTMPGSTASDIPFQGKINDRGEVEVISVDPFEMTLAGLKMTVTAIDIDYYLGLPRLRFIETSLTAPEEWGGETTDVPQGFLLDSAGIQEGGQAPPASNDNTFPELSIPSSGIPLPGLKSSGGMSLVRIIGGIKQVPGGTEITAGAVFMIPGLGGSIGATAGNAANPANGCGIKAAVTLFVDGSGNTTMAISTESMSDPLVVDPMILDSLMLSEITVGINCNGVGIPIDTTGLMLTGVEGTVSLRPDGEFVQLSVTIDTEVEIGSRPVLRGEGFAKVTINPEWGFDLGATIELLGWIEVANTNLAIRENRFQFTFNVNVFLVHGSFALDAWSNTGNDFHFTGHSAVTISIQEGEILEGFCFDYPCEVEVEVPDCDLDWDIPPVSCEGGGVSIETCEECVPGLPPFSQDFFGIGTDFGEFANGAWGFKGYVNLLGSEYGFYIDNEGEIDFGGVDEYMLVTPPPIREALALWEAEQALAARSGQSLDPYAFDDQFAFPAPDTLRVKVPLTVDISGGNVISQVTVATPSDVMFIVSADTETTTTIIAPDGTRLDATNFDSPPVSDDYLVEYDEVPVYSVRRTPNEADTMAPQIRFLPFSTSEDGAMLDLLVDGVTIFSAIEPLSTANVALEARYTGLTVGEHLIELVPTGSRSAIYSTTIDAMPAQHFTVMTAGNNNFDANVLVDDVRAPISADSAMVRLINASSKQNVDLFANGNEIISNVKKLEASDYVELPALMTDFEFSNNSSGQIAKSTSGEIPAGYVVTAFIVDIDGGTFSTLVGSLVDEVYGQRTNDYFTIPQAEMGDWQVELTGDIDNANPVIRVIGVAPATTVSDATLDASDIANAELNATVTTAITPAEFEVWVQPDEVSQTLTFTDVTGLEETVTTDNFGGYPVLETTIEGERSVSGVNAETVTEMVDFSSLESGSYFVWVRVDDGENPPDSIWATAPAGTDPLEIVVDNTGSWPTTWEVSPTLTLEQYFHELYVAWPVLDHPDADSYRVIVNDGTTETVIEAGLPFQTKDEDGNLVGDRSAAVTFKVQPNVNYTLIFEAIDRDTDMTVQSDPVEVSFSGGDFDLDTLDGVTEFELDYEEGGHFEIPIKLTELETLFYPQVTLGLDGSQTARGMRSQFAGNIFGNVMLTPEQNMVTVTVDIATSVPTGTYTVTVNAYNLGVETVSRADEELHLVFDIRNEQQTAISLRNVGVLQDGAALPVVGLIFAGMLFLSACTFVSRRRIREC